MAAFAGPMVRIRLPPAESQQRTRTARSLALGPQVALSLLMRWLAETRPDVARLQELKASDNKFPERKLREAAASRIDCVG